MDVIVIRGEEEDSSWLYVHGMFVLILFEVESVEVELGDTTNGVGKVLKLGYTVNSFRVVEINEVMGFEVRENLFSESLSNDGSDVSLDDVGWLLGLVKSLEVS